MRPAPGHGAAAGGGQSAAPRARTPRTGARTSSLQISAFPSAATLPSPAAMRVSMPSVPLPAPLRHWRWRRTAIRTLAALAALWLTTWLAVPALLQSPLERAASAQLGRAVTVGEIDFRPWSLELTLRDIAVAGADGAPPQLTIDRIYADLELQSLLRLAPVVDAFTVENPALRVTHHGGGRYDVDDILARLARPGEKKDPAEDAAPARLALYNLALTGGRIDFADEAVGTVHEMRDLALAVPFISTLSSQREVKVEPRLAFVLNGSRFDSSAAGTPFAQAGRGEATIRWGGLDIAPYLGYLPASLPVQVQGATLDVDVKLAFEQAPRATVALTGTVQARGVRLADRQGARLLAFERLRLDLADVRPLQRVVHLGGVELDAPVLHAARDAAGRINLAQLVAPAPAPAPAQAPRQAASTSPSGSASTSASAPASASASASTSASAPVASGSNNASEAATAPPAPPAPAWAVKVDRAAVQGGSVHWADTAMRPAAALTATDVALEVTDIALPLGKPLHFKGALALKGGTVEFSGDATDRAAQVQAKVQSLPLPLAAPYLAQVLAPTVDGVLHGTLGVQWTAPEPATASAGATGLVLTAGPLALERFALREGRATPLSLERLSVEGVQVALDARTATLGALTLAQPQATVERGTDGRWMFERWRVAEASAASRDRSAAPGAGAPPPVSPGDSAVPWKLRVADARVEGGAVSFTDHAQPRPVAFEVTALNLSARNLASHGATPEPLELSARVGVPRRPGRRSRSAAAPGSMAYRGTLATAPLALQGRLDVAGLPLHALDGYLARQASVQLLHADAGFRGEVTVAHGAQGLRLALAGDAAIDALRANSTAAYTPKTAAQVGEELLAWKSLALRGVSVAVAPGTAPRVAVRETSLADFFARITVNEAGRINLSDIARTPAEAHAANAASAAAGGSVPPEVAAVADAAAPPDAASATGAAAPGAVAGAPPAAADPLAPVVQFGPVNLVNGRVAFSDFFVRPNYSADLSELTGRLSAFASQAPGAAPVLADLELRGRAEGSASLDVRGKLNPLVQPLALDITGAVRDLELPPLSPYAVKYAGHGIERGKLSMDVHYQVLPSGELTASNRLVLNQLAFGEPVAGAPASLPVRLAVALLADRDGVIDLDLPVSGSLNDPQFRLGPVIGRIIVNLIGKAVTAPFSLLAGALGGSGGGASTGQVEFAPGSAALTPGAQQQLDKMVKALAERPALRITVTGAASLAAEREGLQRDQLRRRVLAEKRRARADDAGPVSADEYPGLLRRVYRRADIPKPRNLIGLPQDLTVPEMEALLLAHQPAATEAAAAALAQERAQAVRAYLVAQKLPAERLFVGAPKAAAPQEKWTPHAELGLATQ